MLYACVGAYSENPYYIEELGTWVHSAEELAYCLKTNITGLEESLITMQLCQFVEKQLKLKELARALYSCVGNKGSLPTFVTLVLEETGMGSKEEIKSIEKLLRENESMGPAGRRKLKGDYYMAEGRLSWALVEYEQAAVILEQEDSREMLAKIYHNMGCVYGRMFFFEKSAQYFMKAYEIDESPESYKCYLASLRLGNNREDYVKKVIDYSLDQEKVGELEEIIGELTAKSKESKEGVAFDNALEKRESANIAKYHEIIDDILMEWKREYRLNMEMD